MFLAIWLIAAPCMAGSPQPSAGDADDYPEQAREQGIEEGSAVIDCALTKDGGLFDCKVLSETPPGAGFGEASIRAAAKVRMRPKPRERGRSVTTDTMSYSRVRLPMRWTLADDPETPPPVPSGD